MAYNSNKGNQHSGDIQYESDPNDTQIDFENDYVALKTNGQRRFIVSGSFITSSVPIMITPTVASAFSIKGSTAGLDVNCAIENTGTDSDDGVLMSYTAQGSAGDPSVRFVIAGNEAYSVGIDNSDGDKFKISNASTLHTATRLTLHGPKLGINTSTPAAALDVNGSTILGSAASDVTTLTGQVTASAGVLLNSTLDVGGNTTLGNAAGDTLSITGRTTAT